MRPLYFLLTGVALAASPQDLLASGHVDEAMQVLEQQVRQSPNDAAGLQPALPRLFHDGRVGPRDRQLRTRPQSRSAKQLSTMSGSGAFMARRRTMPDFFPPRDWLRRVASLSNVPSNWIREIGKPAKISLNSISRLLGLWAAERTKRASRPRRFVLLIPRRPTGWMAQIAEKNKDYGCGRARIPRRHRSQSFGRLGMDRARHLLSSRQPA